MIRRWRRAALLAATLTAGMTRSAGGAQAAQRELPAAALEQVERRAEHQQRRAAQHDARRGATVVGPQRLPRIAQIGGAQPCASPPGAILAANSSRAERKHMPGSVGAVSHIDLKKSHARPSITR